LREKADERALLLMPGKGEGSTRKIRRTRKIKERREERLVVDLTGVDQLRDVEEFHRRGMQ
jgi:hypothetical protein